MAIKICKALVNLGSRNVGFSANDGPKHENAFVKEYNRGEFLVSEAQNSINASRQYSRSCNSSSGFMSCTLVEAFLTENPISVCLTTFKLSTAVRSVFTILEDLYPV